MEYGILSNLAASTVRSFRTFCLKTLEFCLGTFRLICKGKEAFEASHTVG
jgi:hypothetical protein